MVTKFRIQNYKSILDDTIELGKVNVFIGENGSGKSNILEALAMFDAGMKEEVEPEDLYNRGIRVVLPKLTLPQFEEQISEASTLHQESLDNPSTSFSFTPSVSDNIFSKWNIKNSIIEEINGVEDEIFEKLGKLEKREAEKVQEMSRVSQNYEDDKSSYSLDSITDTIINISKEIREIIDEKESLKRDKETVKYIFKSVGEFSDFLIYDLNTKALRGIFKESMKQPVGINGEHLDILISSFNEEELAQLKKYNYLIGWLEDFFLDPKDVRKLDGMKMGKSTSLLYFQDKFMAENHNVFSAENANEGILHVLFYLSVLISRRTPQFFGIDNIETALNPHLCRHLMKGISELAIENEKQIVVTTHNPAILDGLDLTNDDIRLFEVYRGDKGDTRTRRIQFKKGAEKKYKLSEMWMKGMLGAISQNF
ncbi:MAG: AAA15 family ATPase/GTPase [Flammeovirgaceae bacterium]|jgi:AAA15 family ATPase/GTPase